MNDDLIKRSNVYKAVDDWLEGKVPNLNIKDIPSENRPQGRWIEYWKKATDGTEYRWEKCSQCGQDMIAVETNYCPHCGAKMKG